MPPSKQTVDFATREALRKESKVTVERTRGRQHRATAKARSKAKQAEQAQKAQLAAETAQRREDIRTAASQQRAALKEQAKAAQAAANRPSGARRAISTAGTVAGAAGSGVSKTSDTSVGQVAVLVLSIMGGLIIFYLFVTRPNTTNLRSQQLSGWLNLFSTDSPLFVKVPPTKAVGPTVKPGSTTGSSNSGGSNVA